MTRTGWLVAGRAQTPSGARPDDLVKAAPNRAGTSSTPDQKSAIGRQDDAGPCAPPSGRNRPTTTGATA